MSVNTEVFIKTLVIILMVVLFLLQITIGVLVDLGFIDSSYFATHYTFAILLLLLIPIHIYFRYKKLRTLLKEFFKILMGKDAELHSKADRLVDTFKEKNFEDFCVMFAFEDERAREILNRDGFKIEKGENMEELAKRNDEDLFKIFTFLVEKLKA